MLLKSWSTWQQAKDTKKSSGKRLAYDRGALALECIQNDPYLLFTTVTSPIIISCRQMTAKVYDHDMLNLAKRSQNFFISCTHNNRNIKPSSLSFHNLTNLWLIHIDKSHAAFQACFLPPLIVVHFCGSPNRSGIQRDVYRAQPVLRCE